MKRRNELSDEHWEQIAAYLPGKEGCPGRTDVNDRRFVNPVIWLTKTGGWQSLAQIRLQGVANDYLSKNVLPSALEQP